MRLVGSFAAQIGYELEDVRREWVLHKDEDDLGDNGVQLPLQGQPGYDESKKKFYNEEAGDHLVTRSERSKPTQLTEDAARAREVEVLAKLRDVLKGIGLEEATAHTVFHGTQDLLKDA